ncbi:MAG: transcription termination factor NusA [Clostridia bacterium]|nr:transcription termination factor NusA [Clostridia bacterium]MDY2769761.1 transcription termination factor NusA [Eubacteriales bacterium]
MATGFADSAEVISAIDALAKEKKINKEVLYSKIESALVSAYKRSFGKTDNVRAVIDRTTGQIEVLAHKNIVENVVDPAAEISLTDVRANYPALSMYGIGDVIEVPTMPSQFGRIAAQTAKQVIVQHIREAERGVIYDEYIEKENEILTAIVQRVENGRAYVELGRTEGVLEQAQQMPGEEIKVGDRLKVYVLEVSRQNRGPQVMVSRTHPGLVKRLFEIEVPEIRSGVVQIKSIAREAGFRTKMAVFSTDSNIDPVGACVGPRGMRVENVVNELKTEKIDIVKWSSDPKEYIASALSPARVHSVFVADKEKSSRVVVPDNQLSLAIGKEGQNARLAAKLTGWKIDIKSLSQMNEALAKQAEEAAQAEAEKPEAAEGEQENA